MRLYIYNIYVDRWNPFFEVVIELKKPMDNSNATDDDVVSN